MEDQDESVPFGFLATTDADEGSNAVPYYFVVGGANSSRVSVDPVSGLVFLTTPVVRSYYTVYMLQWMMVCT